MDLFSMPPVRATGERALLSDLHDLLAKRKRQARCQRFGEEIRQNVSAAHKRLGDVVRLDALPQKKCRQSMCLER
eukprot:2148933-Pleurochrysis_carterae.AAC.2